MPFLRIVLSAQQTGPVPHHADLTEREGHEYTHDVELDQCRDLGIKGDDEGDRRQGQKHNAIGERQPVAAGVQLARQETVLGQDRTEYRETVERGVGGQHQDQRGHAGDQVETKREIAEDRVGQLCQEGLLLIPGGGTDQLLGGPLGHFHAGLHRQHDHAHEQCDRDAAQEGQCGGGVARFRLAEGRHAVADRFHPGQRRAA